MKKLLVITATLLSGLIAGGAWGQAYPTKPVRIVAPFPPGGGTDFIARLVAQKLTESTKQQFIVDNRPGAGGTLGAEIAVKSPADGYTLLLISGSYAVNPSLYKLKFDSLNDITPIIQVSQGPFIIVTHPSLPVKNVKDFVALLKAKPGAINYATSGQGSITHLATELFLMATGTKMTHVPYRGTGPAVTDTISGQTQVLFGSAAGVVPHIRSGRMRAIAVSTPKRIAALPDVPTVLESKINYEVTLWHGAVGPKGLARPIVDRINGDVNRALQGKDMDEKLATDGVSAAGGPPERFHALIKKDIETWGKVVKQAGVKAE